MPDASNVCVEQKAEISLANVTHVNTINFTEFTWCTSIPPR
jgi:hypothetical protein